MASAPRSDYLFDARLSGARIDIGDREFSAFAGEALHDGTADTAAAAGDDGYFVIDRSHEIPPSFISLI